MVTLLAWMAHRLLPVQIKKSSVVSCILTVVYSQTRYVYSRIFEKVDEVSLCSLL